MPQFLEPVVVCHTYGSLAGQDIETILQYGLADFGGTEAFVAGTVKGTDAEIVGLARREIRGGVGSHCPKRDGWGIHSGLCSDVDLISRQVWVGVRIPAETSGTGCRGLAQGERNRDLLGGVAGPRGGHADDGGVCSSVQPRDTHTGANLIGLRRRCAGCDI